MKDLNNSEIQAVNGGVLPILFVTVWIGAGYYVATEY